MLTTRTTCFHETPLPTTAHTYTFSFIPIAVLYIGRSIDLLWNPRRQQDLERPLHVAFGIPAADIAITICHHITYMHIYHNPFFTQVIGCGATTLPTTTTTTTTTESFPFARMEPGGKPRKERKARYNTCLCGATLFTCSPLVSRFSHEPWFFCTDGVEAGGCD